MYRRSYMPAVAMAAMIAATGSPAILGPTYRSAPEPVKPKRHDPERLAAAEAKRARKNSRRLALG